MSQNVLDSIIKKTREIEIPNVDGKLLIRDLPSITFMDILSKLVQVQQAEVQEVRQKVFDSMLQLASSGDKLSDGDLQAAIRFATPLLSKLIVTTPAITARILQDTVVGITDEHIKYMSTECVVAIID